MKNELVFPCLIQLAYFIAYGDFGARSPNDPTLPYRVAGWVTAFLGLGFVLWQNSRKRNI
jgi:hypothetical protein